MLQETLYLVEISCETYHCTNTTTSKAKLLRIRNQSNQFEPKLLHFNPFVTLKRTNHHLFRSTKIPGKNKTLDQRDISRQWQHDNSLYQVL